MKCRFSLLILLLTVVFSAQSKTLSLHENWTFTVSDKIEWKPATVPGTVHLDLLNNGLIDDPYYADNEHKLRWIENKDWIYKTTFDIDSNYYAQQHIALVFEGLDTYTTILLNDQEIAATDNMFRRWKIDVKPFLKVGRNELRIIFHSPLALNKKNVENAPYELPAANETVDLKVSPYVRKAAYHFGWDWGPRFVTSGIWRPVYLESWNDITIADIHYTTNMLENGKAQVNISLDVLSSSEQTYTVHIGDKTQEFAFKKGQNKIKEALQITNFKEWFPINYGNQEFNFIEYSIYDQSKRLAGGKLKVAIREIELIQEKDVIGTSFYFKVNGTPFYAKGANYIPQDLFLPRVDSAAYEALIKNVVDLNMNMIRVWGGGIYENDYFYDLCDQYGILVWQDFMFANSMYPKSPIFIENIRAEVRDNVKRLRNHPCIALWCGNSEIEVAWGNWGWQKQYGYSKSDSTEIWNTYTSIFHELIPQTLKELDGTRPYVPTSPLSNWGKPENFNHSSMHYWGVWHGREPIENFAKNVGRFIAEYGYQSFPDYETLAKVMKTEDLHLESEQMKNRQKSYIGNGIIADNIKKYAHKEDDFAKWIQLSQQVQAHAYGYAIRQHRVQTPHCMGTLFWQLNDCWPGPSWSIIDYYGNKKVAYESVKKHYKPQIASFEITKNGADISLVSDALSPTTVNCSVDLIDAKDQVIYTHNQSVNLEYLSPRTIQISLPKKWLKRLNKKMSQYHFKLTLEVGENTVYQTNYYPDKNSTILFR